jgi:hypothetical protein
MDYLTSWYAEYRVGREGHQSLSASALLLLVSPFKSGPLNATKLGRDLAKASFVIAKDHTRKGEVYTLQF